MIGILLAFIPLYCLSIGLFWSISCSKSIYRKNILIILNLIILFVNTLNIIIFSLFDLQYYDFNLNLNVGTFLLWEIIFVLSCIILYFSKDEMTGIINENLYDFLIILIIFSLVGASLTSNILITVIFVIIVYISLGLIFYFGIYSKPFKLLRLFFISIILSIIFLILGLLLIYFEFNSFILTEIRNSELNPALNLIISLLFLFGFGIPCGIIPFSIYHLKVYYHDSTYTTLFTITNLTFPIINFILFKFLLTFTYDLVINSLIILIIAVVGLIISITYSLTETFTAIDGRSFSIKKILGLSSNSDFNMILLISAFIGFLPTELIKIEYGSFVFLFIFCMILVKILLFYSLKPVMLETLDDNIKILGGFWKKYKIFGIFYLIGGILLTIPFALGNILINLISNIFTESLIDLPHISFIGYTIWALLIIYFIIILIWVSITFNDIFIGTPKYLKNKNIRPITKLDYFPQILTFILSIFLCTFYFFNNSLFMEIINFCTEQFMH